MRHPLLPLLLCVAWLASLGRPLLAEPAQEPIACAGLEPGPTRTVTRIVDGETVALDDGSELRLLGALVPRAVDVGAPAGQWPAELAAAAELSALLLGRSIELALGGERVDRYGRLRAHAFVRDAEGVRWVQGHLLRQGLARAFAQAGDPIGDRDCLEALLAAEREAREARRGLWADAAYAIRQASRPAELARYRNTFQVVEGRVVRVAQVRGALHLNFSRDRRTGFSASLRGDDLQLLGIYRDDPSQLAGRRVRMRGWIELRPAPAIDLSAAGLVEVLDEPGAGAGTDAAGASAPTRRRNRRRSPFPRIRTGSRPGALERKPPGLHEAGRRRYRRGGEGGPSGGLHLGLLGGNPAPLGALG